MKDTIRDLREQLDFAYDNIRSLQERLDYAYELNDKLKSEAEKHQRKLLKKIEKLENKLRNK